MRYATSRRNITIRRLPRVSEEETVQRFAALNFESRTQPLNGTSTGGYMTWQLLDEAAADLGIRKRERNANGSYRMAQYIYLEPDRGPLPRLCPQGSVCSECHEREATIASYADREYGFAFTCNQIACLDSAAGRLRW